MAEPRTPSTICPPHYWLITSPATAAYTEIWTCQHCALQREISPTKDTEALPTPNAWRRPRGRPRG